MSIFKRKTRKDKRGIVPAAPEKTYPAPSYWETYDGGGEADPYDRTPTPYEAPEPSYDPSPTTYDTPSYGSSDSGSSYSGGSSSSSSDGGSSYSGGGE